MTTVSLCEMVAYEMLFEQQIQSTPDVSNTDISKDPLISKNFV